MLLLSAAGIAILLYVVVQSVAEQIAQESQDNILAASAISILDSARVVEGDISIDLPYSSLSMLDSVTDERAFYAIRLNDEFLSGYPDLPHSPAQNDATGFMTSPPFSPPERSPVFSSRLSWAAEIRRDCC